MQKTQEFRKDYVSSAQKFWENHPYFSIINQGYCNLSANIPPAKNI